MSDDKENVQDESPEPTITVPTVGGIVTPPVPPEPKRQWGLIITVFILALLIVGGAVWVFIAQAQEIARLQNSSAEQRDLITDITNDLVESQNNATDLYDQIISLGATPEGEDPTDQAIPPVNGLDGKNGTNGKDGRDGINGTDGRDGIPGKDGLNGEPGQDGRPGVDGATGEPGKDGVDGLPGAPGKDGAPGLPGKDGVEGLPGPAGKDGLDGAPGKDGIDGTPGVPGPVGPEGPQGVAGPPGPEGPIGPMGPQGPAGEMGPAGPTCPEGTTLTQIWVQTRTDPMMPPTSQWRQSVLCLVPLNN